MKVETLISYFHYRLYVSKKLDHGICGGILLYDLLRKKYEEHQKRCNEGCAGYHRIENDDNKTNDFTYNNILFSERHWKLYAKCAYAIAQHNVWLPDKKSQSLYKEFGLNELRVDKLVYKTKLAALLVFCDTIEPVKAFEKVMAPQSALLTLTMQKKCQRKELLIHLYNVCCKDNCYSNRVMPLMHWTNLCLNNDDFINGQQKILVSQINKLYSFYEN